VLNKIMVIRATVKPHEKSREEGSEDRQDRAPASSVPPPAVVLPPTAVVPVSTPTTLVSAPPAPVEPGAGAG